MSLFVALLLLWSFGWSEGAGIGTIVAMTVYLGAVGAVGAAVARLLVSGNKGNGK